MPMNHSALAAPAGRLDGPADQTRQRISSFEKKPAQIGTPQIANQPAHIVSQVIGMYLRRLPMRRMSCSWCRPLITEPEPRNSCALKKACVITWKIAAMNAPTPHARNMYPSCEMVEYARTFLMSFCASPIVAANNAVAAPMIATINIAIGAWVKIAEQRTTMYTPAVTMVAA